MVRAVLWCNSMTTLLVPFEVVQGGKPTILRAVIDFTLEGPGVGKFMFSISLSVHVEKDDVCSITFDLRGSLGSD